MTSPAAGVPIGVPVHGIGFSAAVGRFFRGYVAFGGRASRGEYWWPQLVLGIYVFVVMIVAFAIAGVAIWDAASHPTPEVARILPAILLPTIVMVVLMLPLTLPSYAIGARRIRDAGFSGWLMLLCLVPGGSIVPLVMAFLPSKPDLGPGAPFGQQAPYGQAPYGQQPAPYGQAPYGQPPSGQPGQPGQPTQQQPYGR
ncbi:DUF805 domain-containing protein [Agrococcus jejuensis]|uniref:Uncharacterized membrane protein YhaH, DUF805 family n=1 Tax=Agrococcus jejuensis TaxID=399736 RepID=A0A1G8CTM5_9MICO|nr:DUF805 domain-containing protein [Agrococcus jejuensis]SDH48835.1 Uncharacterized membrane protein YhaH, DUF805 family [Agrococcus jejuensis]